MIKNVSLCFCDGEDDKVIYKNDKYYIYEKLIMLCEDCFENMLTDVVKCLSKLPEDNSQSGAIEFEYKPDYSIYLFDYYENPIKHGHYDLVYKLIHKQIDITADENTTKEQLRDFLLSTSFKSKIKNSLWSDIGDGLESIM